MLCKILNTASKKGYLVVCATCVFVVCLVIRQVDIAHDIDFLNVDNVYSGPATSALAENQTALLGHSFPAGNAANKPQIPANARIY